MEGKKSHLSLIFCLVITIVIFTSETGGEWLESSEESNELDEFAKAEDELSENDGMLTSSGIVHNRFKLRREAPYSFERNEGEKDLAFDDANIRYILDHMQTRDVNGQTAAAKPASDTFNGKLIRCFIHRCLRSFSPSSHIESKIYCFVFLCFALFPRPRTSEQSPQQPTATAKLTVIYRRRS